MPTRKSGRGRTGGPAEPPLPDRRLMEQQMSAITRLLAAREFASIEEANAYLQEALVEGTLPTPAPTTPVEEAQEVIYQALEATGKRRLDLARKRSSTWRKRRRVGWKHQARWCGWPRSCNALGHQRPRNSDDRAAHNCIPRLYTPARHHRKWRRAKIS